MKRRKALRKISQTISAGFLIPPILSSCKDDIVLPEIQYAGVVGIIGGGAAGLYAADILHTKGVNVRIFEASDTLGGRIRSVKTIDNSPIESDYPIELGAERIIGTDGAWSRIIDDLRIPTVDLSAQGSEGYILDNVFRKGSDVAADPDIVNGKNFLSTISSRASSGNSIQAEVVSSGLSNRVNEILNSWLGNKFGSSNERIGVKSVAESSSQLTRNSNERTLRSNPMQDVLVSRFSKVVPYAELNTQIKNINYSSGKIQLSGFRNGTEQFSAEVDKVIVTVPVSVLRSNDLTFSPSLPQTMTTALSKVAMDASIRVALDFKQNFWGNDVAFIYGGSIAPEYFAGGLGRSQFNKTLSITINGSRAEALSAKSEDQIINELLSELDKAFEGKATLNVRRDDTDKPIYIIRDWSKQPFIKGGISYLRPGASIEDRSAFAEPVQNVLFFAGEATHPTEAGTINGALLSAERAAQQLVSSIVGA